MNSWNKDLGDLGEAWAEQFYRDRGYSILFQNFRHEGAELDLVVQKGQQVVIVEVKTRHYDLESAKLALTPTKIGFMKRAAKGVLDDLDDNVEIQFDLIAYHVRWNEVVYERVEDVLW